MISHEQQCVLLKLIGCSPYSQMLRSTAGKTSTLCKGTIAHRNLSNFQ